jgi:dihydroflavonol-4-reductase
MKRRVLVTGGSGFIGGKLVRLLVDSGYETRAFFREGDDARLLTGLPVDRTEADICDLAALVEAMKGCEGVFHTAGNVSFRRRDRKIQRRVNVEGTRTVIAACRRAGVRRLVHTSTVNTLGVPGEGCVGDERTPPDSRLHDMGYVATKRTAESLALGANGPGLEVVSVNPGTVFGPGDVNANAGSFILAAARLPVIACPPGGTNCVHIDAVTRGHLAAYERGRAGERYILGGENLTYREMFRIIAEALGRRLRILAVPPAPAVVLAFLLERAADVAGIDMPLSADAARAGSLRLYYSSRKARQELALPFLPFRLAAREAVEWYRAEGFLGDRPLGS